MSRSRYSKAVSARAASYTRACESSETHWFSVEKLITLMSLIRVKVMSSFYYIDVISNSFWWKMKTRECNVDSLHDSCNDGFSFFNEDDCVLQILKNEWNMTSRLKNPGTQHSGLFHAADCGCRLSFPSQALRPHATNPSTVWKHMGRHPGQFHILEKQRFFDRKWRFFGWKMMICAPIQSGAGSPRTEIPIEIAACGSRLQRSALPRGTAQSLIY